MIRRHFLFAAAAAPLAAQPARIRIGFLGVTHAHGPAKLALALRSPDYELVGLAEKDEAGVAVARKLGVPVVPRERLLGDPGIRAIAVESEVKDHAADALAALEAGKHVHLEKAPAGDLPSLRRVFDLAAGKRLLVQTGYMWRYNPAIKAALDAAREGLLGEVYMVRGSINMLLGAAQRRPLLDFSGGQMFELAGHLIDPMVRLLGKPAKVTPFVRRQGSFSDALNDNTLAVMEWPGALGMVQSNALQLAAVPHRAFEILGTKGSAIVRPIEPPALQLDLAQGKQTPPMPAYQRYVEDFQVFARTIREGGTLPVTAAQELDVQETLLRASAML